MLAVLYSKLGQDDKSGKCLSRLLNLSDHVCKGDPSLPDEVLYGRAGYLFSLLFVQQHLGTEKINHDIINQVHIKKKLIRINKCFIISDHCCNVQLHLLISFHR